MNNSHLKLKVNLSEFEFNKQQIINSLTLPEKKLPHFFTVQDNGSLCFGHHLFFDPVINEGKLLQYCKDSQWSKVAHILGNFLIIFIDLRKEKIFAISDLFGTFPCYFKVKGQELILSTDFTVLTESLDNRELNLDSALDYIYSNYGCSPTEQTILKDVFQLPPATLLTIEKSGNFEFESLADLNKFNFSIEPYQNTKEFFNDFFKTLDLVLEQRLGALEVDKVACDLSSGFDCTLVAYALSRRKDLELTCFSRLSSLALDDTRPEVMKEFAKKHNLNVIAFNAEDTFPFCDSFGLNWTKSHFFPADHGLELYYQLSKLVSNSGFLVRFTGNGGDELYQSPEGTELEKYPIQLDYFYTIAGLDWDIDCFFSEKGLAKLVDRSRFVKKKAFSSYTSPTTVSAETLFFPIMWDLNLWNVSPLSDPKMIQIARKLPFKNGKPLTREELWKERPDIFIEGQFKYKGHYGKHIGQFLTRKKDFVIDVLRNSQLGKIGVIKAEEMVKNIEDNNIEKYLDKPLLILHNILRLEYFIQQNNVRVRE